jgi:murein DD-endopeptidase MepM/ murein hydrolase activator NlpD
LEDLRNKKNSVMNDISKKNAQMDQLKKTISEADAKIKEIQKQLEPVEKEYNEKLKAYDAVNQKFKQRIRTLYENGENNYMALLLSADSFSSFITRFDFVHMLVDSDYKLVQDKINAMKDVAAKKKQYDALINQQEELVRQAHDEYNKLVEEVKQDKQQLNQIQGFEEQYQDEIIQINLEAWRKGELHRPFTGFTRMPCNRPITSGFGYRYHPVLGVRKLHEGIDFGGPVGTPIYAPGDGVVVDSRVSTGYGWLITIYHGDKNGVPVFTRYAHSYPNQVRVRVGQEVSAGDWITSIGNNGMTTGPHLHFEVRLGQEMKAVDPEPYLPK